MTRSPRIDALVFIALVALAAGSRFIGAAPNFAAVAAVALFAGFYFGGRLVAIAVPVIAMLIADAFLGTYDWRQMVIVYACLAMPVLFRSWLGAPGRVRFGRAMAASLVCSAAFFLFTNLAVWAFGTIYTHDFAGLGRCFSLALPFFRFTLAGDLCFAVLLFGGYALAARSAPGRARPALA